MKEVVIGLESGKPVIIDQRMVLAATANRSSVKFTSVGHQIWLHRQNWTALEDPFLPLISFDTPIWETTKLVMGWSPPDPGPQERAWLLGESELKPMKVRTQRKIAKGNK